MELDGGTVQGGPSVGEELVSCSTDLQEISVLIVAVFGPPLCLPQCEVSKLPM